MMLRFLPTIFFACVYALRGGGHGGGGLDALGVDHAGRGLGITAFSDPD